MNAGLQPLANRAHEFRSGELTDAGIIELERHTAASVVV